MIRARRRYLAAMLELRRPTDADLRRRLSHAVACGDKNEAKALTRLLLARSADEKRIAYDERGGGDDAG